MIHVGISGPIAAGKSTLAKSLRQLAIESGYACDIVPFATGVREVAAMEEYDDIERRARITNLFYSWGYDYHLSLKAAEMADAYMNMFPTTAGEKNRRLLQSIGTEVGRMTVDEHIWIHRVKTQLKKNKDVDFGISDDLRFDNEALAVDVHVGIEVHSVFAWKTYSEQIKKYDLQYTYNQHASEKSLSLPALFTVPCGFTQKHILKLFDLIVLVRKLRA